MNVAAIEELAFESGVESGDILFALAMNLRRETDQLFVPGREQIFSFVQTEFAFVREL